MRQVYRFDENGYFKEPVFINDDEKMPKDCTDFAPPRTLYFPRFIEGKWVNGISEEEIEAIRNPPKMPTELDIIKKQQSDLVFELIMKGVI